MVTITGKVPVVDKRLQQMIDRFENDKPTETVALICRVDLTKTSLETTQSTGKRHVAHVRMDSAIIATSDEGDELLERLTEARAEAAGDEKAGGTANLADSIEDEYSGQSHAQLRKLCKEREINAKGSRLELAQRLRAND